MSTELFRFQINLQADGFTQVSREDFTENTYYIADNQIFVNESGGTRITRFTEEGKILETRKEVEESIHKEVFSKSKKIKEE